MPEFYDLFAKPTIGVEYFDATVPTDNPNVMSDSLNTNNRLLKNYNNEKYSSNEVSNPYGYGYVASLPEVRNRDALDIHQQESTLFALGAVAGVSLIVFSLLISSSE